MGVHAYIQPGNSNLSVILVVDLVIVLVPVELKRAPAHPVPAEKRIVAQDKPPSSVRQFIVIPDLQKVLLTKGGPVHIAVVVFPDQVFVPLEPFQERVCLLGTFQGEVP